MSLIEVPRFSRMLIHVLLIVAGAFRIDSAMADGFTVQRNLRNQIILTGPDCEGVRRQALAIASWKSKLGSSLREISLLRLPRLQKLPDSTCMMNITSIVDRKVGEQFGVNFGWPFV